MKSLLSIVGILLIVFGIIGFSYKYINYTSTEKVAEIGSLKVTADTEKTVFISPLVSGLSLVAGVVLIVAARSRKD